MAAHLVWINIVLLTLIIPHFTRVKTADTGDNILTKCFSENDKWRTLPTFSSRKSNVRSWKPGNRRSEGLFQKWDKRIGIPNIEDRSEVRSARMSLSNVMLKDSLLESGLSLIKYHNYRAEFERCP